MCVCLFVHIIYHMCVCVCVCVCLVCVCTVYVCVCVYLLSDCCVIAVQSDIDLLHLPAQRPTWQDHHLNSTFTTSSETSSICSSRSAIPASSDGGTDEDNMSTLRAGSGRCYDVVDLSGLEESTVDSDDEDVSSVNTEVMLYVAILAVVQC